MIQHLKRAKHFKKFIRLLFSFLPNWLRFSLIRRMVRLPSEINSNVVFKVADSIAELESAFGLVYKDYIKLGYCEANETEMRGTYYHALPSTITLIAKTKTQTTGTLTIVRDNSTFTLPMENTFDLKALRHGGHRLAEITSLVIDPEHRRSQGGQILFPLMKLMYHYCSDYFGVNRLVIAISPKDEDFYQALLLFKRAPQTTSQNYLGAPAVVMYLDLDVAANEFFKVYGQKKKEQNLYHFFKEWETPSIQIKPRRLFDIQNPLLDHTSYNELFVQKLNLQHFLLDRIFEDAPSKSDRFPDRIKVDAPALYNEDLMMKTVQVKNISAWGFQTKFIEGAELGKTFKFRIFLQAAQAIPVEGTLMWIDQQKGCGWKIMAPSQEWYNMVAQYETALQTNPHNETQI